MGSQPPKISVYSTADLKNTTDDALPNYLNSLKFKQSHYLTDVRLALGFLAVAIAGATFYLDYTLGWDRTKTGTAVAVVVFFILNGALSFWIWRVEQGCIYSGEFEGNQLLVRSRVEKYNPTYHLTIRQSTTGRPDDWQTKEMSAPFSTWFDGQGHFVAVHFQRWMATELPLVGRIDPSHVVPQASSDEQVRKGDPRALQTASEPSPAGTDGARRREKQRSGRSR